LSLRAIARQTEGPLTLFDGMHRTAARVAHMTINVVVTKLPAPAFEAPSAARTGQRD